jgi:hypothetical protein
VSVLDFTGAASVRAVLVCHSLAPFYNEIAGSLWPLCGWASLLDPLLMSKRWEVNSLEVLFQPFSILACGKNPGTGRRYVSRTIRPTVHLISADFMDTRRALNEAAMP